MGGGRGSGGKALSSREGLGATAHCGVLPTAALLGPGGDPPTLDAPKAWGVFVVSSVARTGLSELLEALWMRLRAVIDEEAGDTGDEDWDSP